MRQPQKNLFFFFRGALATDGGAGLAFDRQLEDNATKALVYVLENADRTRVLAPFLNSIVGLRGRVRLNEVQFALQKQDIARPSVKRRIALSIAPEPGLKAGKVKPNAAGRPDAWIWAEPSFAVLIEAKARGRANRDQLRRHIAGAEGWAPPNVSILSRSWSDAYGLFARIRQRERELDATSRLLLDEIVRYIRMTGLGSSTTFDLEDFAYFMLTPKDRNETQRALLKRKLLQFTENLSKTRALKRVVSRYAKGPGPASQLVNPGTFGKESTSFWITLGRKERRDRCHFTVRITERGISLEAFSPHKSFTSRLIEKIKEKPADFIRALRSIGRKAPYMIRLREAYYTDPNSSYKGQRIGDKVDYLEIHPRTVTPENLWRLVIEPVQARMRHAQLRPEIFLVRDFPLSELVGNSSVVDDVAKGAEPMLKYLDFALDL